MEEKLTGGASRKTRNVNSRRFKGEANNRLLLCAYVDTMPVRNDKEEMALVKRPTF